MNVLQEIERGQEDWAFCLGVQAYIWGYPIVECWKDRLKKMGAQNDQVLNAFRHVRALSSPESHEFVNAATDFLYSTAVLDLRDGPLVLRAPDFKGRWYVLQILDPYMETIANFGTRTCGDRLVPIVIGNGRIPNVPTGMRKLIGGSDFLYIVARIAVDPDEDMRAVHALQDGLTLDGTRDRPNRARDALYHSFAAERGNELGFFYELGNVLRAVPPKPEERVLRGLLSEIGVDTARGFDGATLSNGVRKGLARAVPFAESILYGKLFETGININGWGVVKNIGNYDMNYVVRALVAKHGIWANVPEESMYFICRTDHEGQLLDGSNRYEITFAGGRVPPVDAFWSISSYDAAGRLTANPWHKTSLNSRYSRLDYGSDGSLTIRLGAFAVDDGICAHNWLPAQAGPLSLTLRCYNPGPELLSLDYQVPAVVRLA